MKKRTTEEFISQVNNFWKERGYPEVYRKMTKEESQEHDFEVEDIEYRGTHLPLVLWDNYTNLPNRWTKAERAKSKNAKVPNRKWLYKKTMPEIVRLQKEDEYIKKINERNNNHYIKSSKTNYQGDKAKLTLICKLTNKEVTKVAGKFYVSDCPHCRIVDKEAILEKRKKTNIERYGVPYASQNETIKEKTKQTTLERYGVENIGESKEIREKIKKTNLERYGFETSAKSEKVKDKIRKSASNKELTEEELMFHRESTIREALINLNKKLGRKPNLKEIIAASGYANDVELYNRAKLGNHKDLYIKEKSFGETKIFNYLEEKGLKFFQEYSLPINGVGGKPLRLDFFLSSLQVGIEYDGIQHFEAVEYWGGEEGLKTRQENDNIKNNWCKQNNVKLIRVPYWEQDNIVKILEKEL